ncbi:MAG: translation initiation factor IF-2 [Cyanobacteria bacterium P01_H01_bin.121]
MTGEDAEKIRAATQRTSKSSTLLKKSPQRNGHAQQSSKPRASSKKQQILEIRRHPIPKSSSNQQVEPVAEGQAGRTALKTPESMSASPPRSQSEVEAVSPNPPNVERSSSVKATQPSQVSSVQAQSTKAVVNDDSAALKVPPRRPSQQTSSSVSELSPTLDVAATAESPPKLEEPKAAPQVINPPQRPAVAASPRKSVVKPNRQRSERPDTTVMTSGSAETSQQIKKPGVRKPAQIVSLRGSGKSDKPKVIKEKSATSGAEPKSPAAKKPQVLELRRPKPARPARTEEAEDQVDTGLQSDVDNDATGANEPAPLEMLEKPRPRRPAEPPKQRKGKGWEEEEDQDAAQKAAKPGSKAKRRVHIVDDDDDDYTADYDSDSADDAVSPAAISLSLMRPPKPKDQQKSPAASRPTASVPRRKKPSEQRDSRNRRDRNQEDAKQRPEILTLTGDMTVQQLAEALALPETDIIKTLFFKGIMATITQTLDVPTIEMVAEEYEVLVDKPERESEARKTEILDVTDLENLQRRPPVVTVMGHVDHGKTTLLDSIRQAKVAQGEAGGITQHIGAYHVDVEHNGAQQQVVFLDTPGHEAFTAMRARGTRVTDIAILVVAADDGVRPQTIEAISHAKAAEVPIIVAINKIDKEGAQPERVQQELTEHGLVPEDWGGDTVMVPVSAIRGENLDTLLDMILLVSEVEELSANPDRPAKGTIIEAHLDKARGPVATLLVQNGTLRVGDIVVAGAVLGKVRAMIDDQGQRVESASPSFAVEILGLGEVPEAGDEFEAFLDEKEARTLADKRAQARRTIRLQQQLSARRVTLSSLSAQAQEGELKELNLILKADVQGSLEAILGSLGQLPQGEVQLRTLLAAPGEVTETDVDLAAASGALILGFNTTLASGARRAADEAGVDVREYDIIYKLLEDVQGAMEGLLEPELVEEPLGEVEVRAVFPVGRGAVAGCYVLSGKVARNCHVRVHRGKEVVYTGTLDSLRRIKEVVKEVNAGYECGIGIDNFNAWKESDRIETFRMVTKRRTLATK